MNITDIRKLRSEVTNHTVNLFDLADSQPDLKELNERRENLRQKMNLEKLRAVEAINEKYSDELSEIDEMEKLILMFLEKVNVR